MLTVFFQGKKKDGDNSAKLSISNVGLQDEIIALEATSSLWKPLLDYS